TNYNSVLLSFSHPYLEVLFFFSFFFQAEDGIRDFHVTGVQTCALPICPSSSASSCIRCTSATTSSCGRTRTGSRCSACPPARAKIGRASCRERVGTTRFHGLLKIQKWYNTRLK